jgi:hypothetical protein
MYKNKAENGANNLCGRRVKAFREALPGSPSQKAFSDMLQIEGLDLDKNAVQRIESGKRFVTDIELRVLARVLRVAYEDLIGN